MNANVICMYEYYIEDELDYLKSIIENNKYSDEKAINFISNYSLQDELSGNDIADVQQEFMNKAQVYLKNNYKGKFIMYCDWCVHVCTVEFYKKYINRNVYIQC
ncbi:MAG: hypothetical protein ACRC1T_05420 [Clostridium chrysemydis]|uniref:hypothetical protein n=1 Tax=Clostridium chrysemydis TaxID=2665504 RepID=UPI003F3FC350